MVALDDYRDDAALSSPEVHHYAKPSSSVYVLAVKALAIGARIQLVMVRPVDGPEDCIEMCQ